MRILHTTIAQGETVLINMDIATLPTRSTVVVPIIVSRGKKPGPSLLLMGGIHGDELNGVEIVRQIIEKGYNKPDVGTIICIPLLNVFGFINQTREFPDGRDLNRVFPGSKDGSLASRFAFHLMKEIIPHVNYCIDYHTGAAQRFNYTQIRIDGSDEESVRLAKVFAAPFVMYAPNRARTFREAMIKLNKKVLLFEGGKSLYLDKTVTKIGIQGAINIIHELGLRDFSSKIVKKQDGILIKSSKWIRAKHSGLYRSYVSVGQKVDKGIVLGSISDPFGEFEKTFKNNQAGYVLNSNHSPIVNQGDALFHIGYE